MYTPITWAEPNRLAQIREKRTIERSNQIETKSNINNYISLKHKLIEIISKPFSFAKTVKYSFSS